MKAFLIAASAMMVCAGAAYAQNNTSSSNNATSGSSNTAGMNASGMNNTPIREQVKDNLQKAGFQDISVTPASFLVHAKDKSGHPTAMVVTPDSMTIVTDLSGGSASNGTSGSSAQNTSNKQ